MFLPYRSKNPPESLPVATVALIAINVAVYALTSDHGMAIRRDIVDQYAVSYANWTLLRSFTSMFLHGSPLHLIGNMWFLYLFGFAVEGRLRSLKFIAVYLAAGFAGDALQMAVLGSGNPAIPSFGASGAIMGVLGAALYMFPFARVDFVYSWFYSWWGTTTLAMYWVAIYYLGADLLLGLAFSGADGVGHFAHLGGAAGGLIACALTFPKRDRSEVSVAKADLCEVSDYGMLHSRDLLQLASAAPNDTNLALNWLDRCMFEGRISLECRATIIRLMPEIVEHEPPLSVASALLGMVAFGEKVNPDDLINVGTRVEVTGESSTALRLYDTAMQIPTISDSSMEDALFRSGMVLETRIHDLPAAKRRYEALIAKTPMSLLADQARMRLRMMDPLSRT